MPAKLVNYQNRIRRFKIQLNEIIVIVDSIGGYCCWADRNSKDFTWNWTDAAMVWYVWISQIF